MGGGGGGERGWEFVSKKCELGQGALCPGWEGVEVGRGGGNLGQRNVNWGKGLAEGINNKHRHMIGDELY